MPYKKPTIFLSYAREDAAIAKVIQKGLKKLSKTLEQGLEIIRDVHTFRAGHILKDQILEKLEVSDFLFIIYTERLKKSHSYTGFEVGVFRMLMRQEIKTQNRTDRKIVSLYINEMPASEQDILGIKLDIHALEQQARARPLDRDKALPKFFFDIVDLYVQRTFGQSVSDSGEPSADMTERANQKENVRASKRAIVRDKVIPFVEKNLRTAFSALVASTSIEQWLFKVVWSSAPTPLDRRDGESTNSELPAPTSSLRNGTVLAGSEFIANNSGAFRIFGIERASVRMSWESFRDALIQGHEVHSAFILNALEDAARSAFSSGPVDNEQFFVSPDEKMYRILVTRHYSYYDGSRRMHMYFVPMLSRFAEGLPSNFLAVLNVATRFRIKFLENDSEFALRKYEVNQLDFRNFKDLVRKHLRHFLLIQDEVHVYKLDDPVNYNLYNTATIDPIEIARLFQDWRDRKKTLVDLANKLVQAPLTAPNSSDLMQSWISFLRQFNEYVDPLNKSAGCQASKRLNIWFDTGRLS